MRKLKHLRNPSDPGRPGFYEQSEYMNLWAYVGAERAKTGKSISAICSAGSFRWYDARVTNSVEDSREKLDHTQFRGRFGARRCADFTTTQTRYDGRMQKTSS